MFELPRGQVLDIHICNRNTFSICCHFGSSSGLHLGPFIFYLLINECLSDIFDDTGVKYLLFRYDVKLFLEINTTEDCHLLQNAHMLVKNNLMSVYPYKAKKITSIGKKNADFVDYSQNWVVIESTNSVRDLGVTFDFSLKLSEHIDSISSKVTRMLRLIIRSPGFGLSSQDLVTMYKALDRQNLKFAWAIWSLHQFGKIDRLQSPKRFTRVLSMTMGFNYLDVLIADIKHHYKCLPHSSTRNISEMMLLHKPLDGKFDCSFLLHMNNIRVQSPSRSQHLFGIGHSGTNYQLHTDPSKGTSWG